MGIMIGDRAYWSRGYGSDAIITSLNHVFSQTDLKRIYLKTLDWNIKAQNCFKKCGFSTCGQLIHGDHYFILMEIHCPAKPQESRTAT
jgi:RimJ/RimL family protein N-acetyltransferase